MTQYEATLGILGPLLVHQEQKKRNVSAAAAARVPTNNAAHAQALVWSHPTTVVNTTLAAVLFLVAAFYIAFANGIAAGRYGNKLLQSRVAAVAESNGMLEAQKTTSGDTMNLLEFARQRAMIPAFDAAHLFEDKGVALNR